MPTAPLFDLPWWTETDQAEFETLLWELVDRYVAHRESCAQCEGFRAGTLEPCRHVGKAIQIVLEWIFGRELRSRAEWFRYRRVLLQLELEASGMELGT